ncbi:MAG: C-terminal helicase domain-containing protein [Gammaproteobacteria bacterium]|nr:C-terminal helicase domain-containing protein [Gammaproteobacteria bacterium]
MIFFLIKSIPLDDLEGSTVRANSKNRVGFTDDPGRLNVAATRSKFAYIALINAPTFENQQTDFSALIEHAIKMGVNTFYEERDFIPMKSVSKVGFTKSMPAIHYSQQVQEPYSKSSANISKQSHMISQHGIYSQPRQNKAEGYVPQINIASSPKIIAHTSEDEFPSLPVSKGKKDDLRSNDANTLKASNTLSTFEPSKPLETKKPLRKKQGQLQNKKINFHSLPDEQPKIVRNNNNNAIFNRNNNF